MSDYEEHSSFDFADSHNPENSSLFRILVSSDNHLGCHEDDPVRGNDSFKAFEEVLTKGNELGVDFVLLAGDLFHKANPSRATMCKALSILRRHVLGNREVGFEVVSDQSVNFPSVGAVNTENANLNVKLPVFAIHGNHDDLVGSAALSALDELALSGTVNYFGKATSFEPLEIAPVLLVKGRTKLALYGLGALRDARLRHYLALGKVVWKRPAKFETEWFNVLVLHQNRLRPNPEENLDEELLPTFLDLVVWGHEHEARMEFELPKDPALIGTTLGPFAMDNSTSQSLRVLQPGSTVATSLCPDEAVYKKVGLLSVRDKTAVLEQFPLAFQRSLVLATLALDESLTCSDKERVVAAKKTIDTKAKELLKTLAQTDLAPLLRIRCEAVRPSLYNKLVIEPEVAERVANPKSVLLFFKKNRPSKAKKQTPEEVRKKLTELVFNKKGLSADEELARETGAFVGKVLAETTRTNCTFAVLSRSGFLEAFQLFTQDFAAVHLADCLRNRLDELQTRIAKNRSLTSFAGLAALCAKENAFLDKHEEAQTAFVKKELELQLANSSVPHESESSLESEELEVSQLVDSPAKEKNLKTPKGLSVKFVAVSASQQQPAKKNNKWTRFIKHNNK